MIKKIRVGVPTDNNGLIGRECPKPNCHRYFKIKFGTGLEGPNLPCHCPYCGFAASPDDFMTKEQLKLVQSEITKQFFVPAINEMSRKLEASFRHSKNVSFRANRIDAQTFHYLERDLETEVVCESCSLIYAVYGVFAFCPDCRQHNSIQMLSKNISLILRMLDMAVGLDDDIQERQFENALEDCVSSFDGFGRELCKVSAGKFGVTGKLKGLSFQNLEAARQNVSSLFGVDFSAALPANDWSIAIQGFQKRHLIAHKYGVVDEEYTQRSGDTTAVVGRKVCISDVEVREVCRVVLLMSQFLSQKLS